MTAGFSVNEFAECIPLLKEERWLRHQENAAKPPLKGADGVVDDGPCFKTHSYLLVSDHPGRATSERVLFLDGTATPPSEENAPRCRSRMMPEHIVENRSPSCPA